MCGLFGGISAGELDWKKVLILAKHARQRGKDSSGIVLFANQKYEVNRADNDIIKLLNKLGSYSVPFCMGHSRLITNGLSDNQPVSRDDMMLIHNGIVTNETEIWQRVSVKKKFQIDSEAILAIAKDGIENGVKLGDLPKHIFKYCRGTISAALAFPNLGKVLIFSNNGSLFVGQVNDTTYFASERYALEQITCKNIKQIFNSSIELAIPKAKDIEIFDQISRSENLIPALTQYRQEEKILEFHEHSLKRCSRCILPETMPFIKFDENGVCNYCKNYSSRNKNKPKSELLEFLEKYRKTEGAECIVPFSGGRDSCWGLHLIVNELKLKPITYTYDWGMVTDLGRRNISRMCSKLGVENIIVAADISKKRRNIAKNLKSWLKYPDLGMISILTAGDKHFFKYVNTVRQQTGISLNLWSINPLEVTHFKSGFLGVKPDFAEERVYNNGALKQLNYQFLRVKAMSKSLGYFNSSLWDTLSGEYYRSFSKKTDYYHLFDYWNWNEKECDSTLKCYDWELAPDTNTTWRIGDGTAAFYNYIYYHVVGFTEHDTFRSNQIREGQISRKKALELVADENRPRYQNLKWYLDALNMNFKDTIKKINSIPRRY